MKLLKQLQVFLLYSHSDKTAVRQLYQRLVKTGVRVWLDVENILPGQDWEHEIHKAIHGSDIVIICLTKQFNKEGGYRHEELRIALEWAGLLPEGVIFLVPARLEECETPESLSRWQRVDLFSAGGYKRLINAIKAAVASA
jgi:hypothetical protein